MPAEFENGVFGGGVAAWHGLGTVVEEDVLTAAQVIEIVPELGYDVELVPMTCEFQGSTLETGRYATVRSDKRVLGAGLSDLYKVIQNRDVFSFIDSLVDSGEAKYHTAGTLKDGRVAWLLAKATQDLVVGGIESERIEKYLLATNSFDGTASQTSKWVRTRVVCQNTLDAALDESGREIRIRHTGTLEGKIEEARRVLEIGFAQDEQFLTMANDLVSQQMTSAQMGSFLERLIPFKADESPDKDRSARNKQEARNAIAAIFNNAGNLEQVRGTKWAAYNAVAEYFDHHTRTRSSAADEAGAEDSRMENRMLRIVSDYRLKDQALALLTK